MLETLQKLCKQWEKALLQEAEYVQKFGAKRFPFIDAVRIEQSEDVSIYEAQLSTGSDSKSLPVSMPLEIELNKKRYAAEVLFREDDYVVLEIGHSLGTEIPNGEILVESSFLLKQLMKRLEEVREEKTPLQKVHSVLKPKKKAKTASNASSSLEDIYFRTLKNPVTFVWGPPGTGKTYNLSRVIAQHYTKGKKILVLSHSNAAVDVLMENLVHVLTEKKKWKDGDVLRIGQPITPFLLHHPSVTLRKYLIQQHPEIDRLTSKVLDRQYKKTKPSIQALVNEIQTHENNENTSFSKWRKKEKEAIEDAAVIGTTISKASIDKQIYTKYYDLVVIDEASMINIPQIAFCSTLAEKTLIAGDFKQLPPIAQSREKLAMKWLQQDIFHAAGVASAFDKTYSHPQAVLLTQQRRMHQDISSFTNKYIYHDLVGDHPSILSGKRGIHSLAPFPNKASQFIDTTGFGEFTLRDSRGQSRLNPFHAILQLQLTLEAVNNGITSIGLMTPYAAQAQLLKRLIQDFFPLINGEHDIFAATVHQFQGEEKDLVIFDSVDSPPEYRASLMLTKEEHERLLTVAFTRSKSKFFHIGHRRFLETKLPKEHLLQKWIHEQQKHNTIVSKESIGNWIHQLDNRLLFTNGNTAMWNRDIERSKKSIVMGGPIRNNQGLEHISSRDVRKVWVGECSPPTGWEHVKKDCTFSFFIADEKVLWLQIAIPNLVFRPYVSIRINSPNAVEWLQNIILSNKEKNALNKRA
ncbi:DEAD/DEAH box helicase [Mangrovibacillus cuniculi]|uniref:AAA family ATPase n=1 Tax=Mangrovibacillus cuniculi TaxID=2593652 RepID=A0A7S8HF21_9BACI|nr:AAA domain-containing protein [Mangrovibacillus cuniculi]QPC46459.1 AAA family ATPase [Mangrovibacillus cuniculi]